MITMIRFEDLNENNTVYLNEDESKFEWGVYNQHGTNLCSAKPCRFIAKGPISRLSFREDYISSNSNIVGNVGIVVGPGCYAKPNV